MKRIVSIVPSLTEAIAQTPGGREALVGATDWCTHPHDLEVPRIGGTKNPDVAAIAELAPDVVVANEEENRPADLEALAALPNVQVQVTHIRSVPEALQQLPVMLAACGLPSDPDWLLAARTAWHTPPQVTAQRGVVLIWRRPWMAVGCDTFTGDVLARLGVSNVLADAPDRYPTVTPTELPEHDLVVLPDEPYEFSASDGPEAFDQPCALVSGRLLTWYGPSMADAPAELVRQLTAAQ